MRRSMRWPLAVLALVSGFACSYGFDAETDRFACDVNDDCLDGFVCGGHTMTKDGPLSYCVKAGVATIGFRVTTMYDATTSTDGTTCTFDEVSNLLGHALARQVWMATSDKLVADAAYSTDPQLAVTLNNATALSDTGCVGTMQATGKLQLTCRLPAANGWESVRSAAVWVAMYDSAKQNPGPSDWWAVVASTGDLGDGQLYAASYVPTFDEYMDDDHACSQAVSKRVCPPSSSSTFQCGSCTANAQCPSGFHCASPACVHDTAS